MVAVIFYSPLLFQTRVAHITAEGNITHEVHITRRRRIELAHLLYRRCAIFSPLFHTILLARYSVLYDIFFGRNIRDVFAYAKVMLLPSFVMKLLPMVAMM